MKCWMKICSSYRSIKTLGLLALALAFPRPSHAEDAAVYFFTGGSLATTGVPGSKHGLFGGNIFDGNQRIGFIWRNRYVAVTLAPGTHDFSASLSSKHPAENSHASFVLEANKTYFIRAQSESYGIVIIGSSRGRLEEVSCAVAHEQAAKAVPVNAKHISPEFRGRIVPGKALPLCP